MDNGERKKAFFKSWKKIATILSQHNELNYFFVGGLGTRMKAAAINNTNLAVDQLRNHQDIDLIVFDEDFISFLKVFENENFDIWHTPLAGLSANATGEFHSVSMRDRETDVDIGLFRATQYNDGRLITTNYRKVFHPLLAFDASTININDLDVKTMSIEWLYYMSVLQVGEKKRDGQLVSSGVDFDKFNALQLSYFEMNSNLYEYYRFVDGYDAILKSAGVLNL
jgi:hypothetical protein